MGLGELCTRGFSEFRILCNLLTISMTCKISNAHFCNSFMLHNSSFLGANFVRLLKNIFCNTLAFQAVEFNKQVFYIKCLYLIVIFNTIIYIYFFP